MAIVDFVSLIRRSNQQKTFYHFTDSSNIPSIKKNGLLSMSEIRKRGLDHVPGGNELSHNLDIRYGWDRYVHLCFRRKHRMAEQIVSEGRIATATWLAIDPAIASLPGVLITPDNAVKTGVTAYPVDEAIKKLDLNVLYDWTDWSDSGTNARLRAAERYEILVPLEIATPYITF